LNIFKASDLKVFVIDTNVALTDPRCLYKFEDNLICIPLIVIEELDNLKKNTNEIGRNAREFSRIVDALREEGSLETGVKLDTGATVIVKSVGDISGMPADLNPKVNDDLILYTALKARSQYAHPVVMVSCDLNVRIKANSLGLNTEDFKAGKIKLEDDELYAGYKVLFLTGEELSTFRNDGGLDFMKDERLDPMPNEYLILKQDINHKSSALARFCGLRKRIVPLMDMRAGVWGIHPKNAEQRFALDALLNDDIKLVSLIGKAGTGKTLLAVAAGLESTIAANKFTRVLISRPVVPMGKDIGYLPGDINEKLNPWMQPIYDNLDFLFTNHGASREWQGFVDNDLIKVEALTYIRGRSIAKQFLIIDEAQNLSPHEIKTIVTRVADGTKVILTGDCDQIDSPYLDSINNGLAYCVDRMKHELITAHVTLKKGERSELAEIASRLL